MILVTTGSSGGPFDRLLSVIERFDVDEEIVVQHGPSALRPGGTVCVDYVPFDELSRLVSRARVVVSHAGVGSILLCMSHGHRPVVVPRLARFGEVVDDHQLELARRLAALGAVTCVGDLADLAVHVAEASRPAQRWHQSPRQSALAQELRRFVDSHIDETALT